MTRSTRTFLSLLVVTSLLGVLIIGAMAALGRIGGGTEGTSSSRGGQILSIHLEGAYPESDPNAAINELFGARVITLHELLAAIRAAGADEGISAIQLR